MPKFIVYLRASMLGNSNWYFLVPFLHILLAYFTINYFVIQLKQVLCCIELIYVLTLHKNQNLTTLEQIDLNSIE